tara:strand:- start:370 stop:657 length:288 start_codon:yes stop_codon:yes gene_type:complete
MPTKREREYYSLGFGDGIVHARRGEKGIGVRPMFASDTFSDIKSLPRAKPKRKMSAWNKYVKANSKKPRFRLRSGKINLKKMGVAFRKTPAGRKK